MRLATFFDKFELFAEAPNAVAKMRELILQLAVQGNLVPNNAEESPVSLEMTEVALNEKPKPANWRRGILGDVIQLEYGDNLPAPKRTQTGEYPVYGSNGIVGTHDTYLTREPAIIVGRKGSAGALNIATGPSWITDVAYFVRPPSDLDLRFAYYLLSSLNLDELGKGIKPGLSRKEAYELPVTLPPLAEQKRIVAKVDALMALCDRLEAELRERDTRQAALARAVLAGFAEAPTPANLELLFHPSYAISPADLRKTILTLAVQGKLVPQNPSDKPISVLRQNICANKVGTTNRANSTSTPIPQIEDNEKPFELPEKWEWLRLGELLPEFQNGVSSRGDKDGRPVVVLRLADINNRRISLEQPREIPIASGAIAKYSLRNGDVLITRVNGSADIVGSFIPVESDIDAIYCDHFIRMRIDRELMCPSYIALLGETQFVRDQISSLFVTTAGQKTVNQGHIGSLLIVVPPLFEQRRIVAKVDQLMALVGQLEAQLAASRAAAANLMEAVVAELIVKE